MEGRVKDDVTYETQNKQMAVRKTELEFERSELNKEKVVDDAVRFVTYAGDIWRTAKAENKVLFQKPVYETGLTVNPDKTFGTDTLGLICQQLTDIENYYETNKAELPSENSALVHPARFERTTSGTANQRSIQLSYGCKRSDTHSEIHITLLFV